MSESSDSSIFETQNKCIVCRTKDSRKTRPCYRSSHRSIPRLLASCGYFIGSKINTGSFATVRAAIKRIGPTIKPMAVKIIDKDRVPNMFVKKFLPREMAIWPSLRHNNIIQIYQILYVHNTIYAFMEFAPNGTVIEFLQRHGAVDEFLARRWCEGLCQGLSYCHSQNIAHRDVKCDNLLLGQNFEIKIGDFGFCCAETNDFSETFCGSTAYVAPEILQGLPYDPMASDIWSAGICIYVMLNNAMPFDDSNIKRMLSDQLQGNWYYPLEDYPSLEARTVIGNMMQPHITHRWTLDDILRSKWLRYI